MSGHTLPLPTPSAGPTQSDSEKPVSDMHTSTQCYNDSDLDSSLSSLNDAYTLSHQKMSLNTFAEVLHAEPKHIPPLSPGKISPLVMWQWEMACKDSFSANKRLDKEDDIVAA